MASKIRSRIISKAVKCFARFGYAGCSTKYIAQQADVTEGSLFRLFEAKEKLFAEALDAVIVEFASGKQLRNFHLRLLAFAILEAQNVLIDRLKKSRVKVSPSQIRVHLPAFEK